MSNYPDKHKIKGKFGQTVWEETQKERLQKAEYTKLPAKNRKQLWFVPHQHLIKLISDIESQKGFLSSLQISSSTLQKLTNSNLEKEAYYSSRIEGAVTSLEEALLNFTKQKMTFSDESMQMISNNKAALQFMQKSYTEAVSHNLIYHLHELLMHNTHRARPITIGRYRKGPIYVVDGAGRIVYEGPPADQVKNMMENFIKWINHDTHLHPLLKAGLAHYYFVYVHPFDDGNGRSARALSNLILDKSEYKFINFLSPSDYFEHNIADYYRSIRQVESHELDTTYFLMYFLSALSAQLAQVKKDFQKEYSVKNLKTLLSGQVYA
ncbi:MAG: Fic family protein, partial [Fibrobacteria bacterium]|nr:Fic family protein [Fibrobacteria bacterium]